MQPNNRKPRGRKPNKLPLRLLQVVCCVLFIWFVVSVTAWYYDDDSILSFNSTHIDPSARGGIYENSAKVVFSSDSKLLACSFGHYSGSKYIYLIDVNKGKIISKYHWLALAESKYDNDFTNITSLLFDRENKLLAAVRRIDSSAELKVFKIPGLEEAKLSFDFNQKFPNADIKFSPSASTFTAISRRRSERGDTRKEISFCNLEGEVLGEYALPAEKLAGEAVYSPDGRFFAVAGEHKNWIRVLNSSNGSRVASIKSKSKSINALRFSRDGKSLFVGNLWGVVELWNIKPHKLIRKFRSPIAGKHAIAISPDGKLVAFASSETNTSGMEVTLPIPHGTQPRIFYKQPVILVELESGKVLKEFVGHYFAGIYSLAFSDDGNFLASQNSIDEVKLWKIPQNY